jgi:hypothetical protein
MQFDKTVKIDPLITMSDALLALADFVENWKLREGLHQGVAYNVVDPTKQTLFIYQTKTCYVVRLG